MADIFDEVDSALQREKAAAFWQNHGNTLIAVALLVIVAVGANAWWQQHQRQALEVQTAQLLEVLLPVQGETVKEPQAEATLKNLQANGTKQLDVIAGLQLASRYEQAGKTAEALATLEPIMNRRYTDTVLSDLATVQYVRISLADNEAHKGAKTETDLLNLLQPLAAKDRPFRFSAMELQGLILQQQGKTQEAMTLFKALSGDEGAPATLRERAQAYVITAESQQ